jgi:hypothetical protein
MADILIREIDTLADYAGRKCDLRHCVVQGLDLRAQSPCLGRANVSGAVFLSDEPEEVVEFISAFKLGELA